MISVWLSLNLSSLYILLILFPISMIYGNSCANQTIPKPTFLSINCLQYNITGYECANYIGIYLFNYAGLSQSPTTKYEVPTQGYSPVVNPQDTIFFPVEYFKLNQQETASVGLEANTTATTLQMWTFLQIDKLFYLNDVSSTMKTSVVLTLAWVDLRLRWNASLTPLAYDYFNDEYNTRTGVLLDEINVQISTEYIWTPAFTLLNSASDDAVIINSMAGNDRAIIYPSGLVKWRLKGNVETYCTLDLKWFPFDTQTCSLQFSSRARYLLNGLNFTYTSNNQFLRFNTKNILASEFSGSPAWTLKNAYVSRKEVILFGEVFQNTQSVLVYTLKLQRNSKFYFTTAIIPQVLVTSLAIASLWVGDYGARLGLTITALLTTIASLVSSFFFWCAEKIRD